MAEQYASEKAVKAIKAGKFPNLRLSKKDQGGAIEVEGGPIRNGEIISATSGEKFVNTNRRIPNSLWGSLIIGFLHSPDEKPEKSFSSEAEGWEWENGRLVFRG